MDTEKNQQQENQLQQTNTFIGGMNTDTSDFYIPSNQYRYAENIQIITDQEPEYGEAKMFAGLSENTQINLNEYLSGIFEISESKQVEVVASTSLREYGFLIVQGEIEEQTEGGQIEYKQAWAVIRFKDAYDGKQRNEKLDIENFDMIFGPCVDFVFEKRPSIVCRYEADDNAKIYIADGVHPIMLLQAFGQNGKDYNNICSYPQIEFSKPIFCGLISGQLKSGLVQYSYSLYKTNLQQTEISPATRLIPIVKKEGKYNGDGVFIRGAEKDKITNSGVRIKINIDSKYENLSNIYIYRITYTDINQIPTVEIIYDGDWTRYIVDGQASFIFNDTGKAALSSLTLEEYNSSSGIHIIPKVIESKYDYLFAANVKAEVASVKSIDDWDARAFSYGYNNGEWVAHLFDYNNADEPQYKFVYGSNVVEEQAEQYQSVVETDETKNQPAQQQFKLQDCYNKYTDLKYNQQDLYRMSDEQKSQDFENGYLDRFDPEDGGVYGGRGVNVSWRFVVSELVGDASKITSNPGGQTGISTGTESAEISLKDDVKYSTNIHRKYITYEGELLTPKDPLNASDMFEPGNISGRTYANPVVSYYMKSLRRDEVYRYGIILYDLYGHASPVKWIADIRTPSMSMKGFETFISRGAIADMNLVQTDSELDESDSSVELSPAIITPGAGDIGIQDDIQDDDSGNQPLPRTDTIDGDEIILPIDDTLLAPPVASKASGTYTKAFQLRLSSRTGFGTDTTIMYKTSYNAGFAEYTGPITINRTTTVWAYCTNDPSVIPVGYNQAKFEYILKCKKPTIVHSPTKVEPYIEIDTTDSNYEYYYSINNSVEQPYSERINLTIPENENYDVTIKTKAVRSGWEDSDYNIVTYSFTGSSDDPGEVSDEIIGDRFDLIVRPLGIEFTVKNLPDDCIGYEIVRCNRTESDISTITQGVLSRPMSNLLNPNYSGDLQSSQFNLLYTPTGYLSTTRRWVGRKRLALCGLNGWATENNTFDFQEWSNFNNDKIYQFVSPEIVYQKDYTYGLINNTDVQISTIKYLFSEDANWNNVTTQRKIYANGNDAPYDTFMIHAGISNSMISLGASGLVNNTIYYNEPLEVPAVYISNQQIYDRSRFIPNVDWVRFGNTINYFAYTCIFPGWPTALSLYYPKVYDNSPKIGHYVPRVGYDYTLNKWASVSTKSYSYIKLYEQSDDVILRTRDANSAAKDLWVKKQSDDSYVSYPLFATEQYIANSTDITDSIMASELHWYDFDTDVDESGDTSLKYTDYQDAIGGASFCNWIGNAAFGLDPDGRNTMHIPNGTTLQNFYEAWLHVKDDGRSDLASYSSMGPGGRCLLINVADSWENKYILPQPDGENVSANPLSDIIASKFALTANQNYSLSDNRQVTKYAASGNQFAGYEPQTADIVVDVNTLEAENIPTAQQVIYGNGSMKNSNQCRRVLYMPGYASGQVNLQWVGVYGGSYFGTVLSNIRKSVTPYNGCSKQHRDTNVYYSYGDYTKKTEGGNTTTVFDGDCYIEPFEYISQHKFYDDTIKNTVTHAIIYSIPVETNINLAYTSGEEFSRNYYKDGITNLQITAGSVYNAFSQKDQMYQYNTVYGASSTARVFAAYSDYISENYSQLVDYRCVFSNKKENDEQVDSWVKFQPANYLDVDTRFGEITNMRLFKNKLLFWQKHSFGSFQVLEQVTMQSQQSTDIILGTGGVLDRYDYISTTNGMAPNDYSDTQSYTTLYWWDRYNNQILAYATQDVVDLSAVKTVQKYLKSITELSDVPEVQYFQRYNEVLFSLSKDDVLVYNENINQFSSVYTMCEPRMLQISGTGYVIDRYLGLLDDSEEDSDFGNIYEIYRLSNDGKAKTNYMRDSSGRQYIMPNIKIVVNKHPQINKVFDNVSFGGKFNGGNGVSDSGNDDHVFEFETPLRQKSYTRNSDITFREYDYRLAVGRDNNAEYGNRMRGKTMNETIKPFAKSGNDISIQYIINNFRISYS